MSDAAATGTHAIDAEIFSAGTWNDEPFTVRDLHEIARNFRHLRGQLRPPLKFGHDEGQTLLGQADGDPALGWVERLWVAGDKLLARFAGVPRVVVDAIRAGRYRRVSAELYTDVRQGGRKLGKALKAVALLGADLPAVTNLGDLTAYLATRAATPDAAPTGSPGFAAGTVRAYALPVVAGRIPTPSLEDPTMDEPTLNPAAAPGSPETEPQAGPVEPAEAGMADDPPAELAALRAYKERREAQDAQAHRRRTSEAYRTAREGLLAFCAEQVRAGRLTPHLHERLQRELDGQVRGFAEGRPLSVSADWVRRLLESLPATHPPGLPQGEVAFAAPAPEAGAEAAGEDNPSATLARLAANAMAELHLSYGEAAAYVMRTQPSLARAYRDYTLNPSL